MSMRGALSGLGIVIVLVVFFVAHFDAAVTPKYVKVTAVKAGVAASGDFSGNPKKATITFTTAFADANYSFFVLGVDERSWAFESHAAGSIVINSGDNAVLSGNVLWTAVKHADP